MSSDEPGLIGRLAFCAAAAGLLICSSCWASENGGPAWYVEDATLRFRIEQDPNYAELPDVHLAEIKAAKGPSDLRRPVAKGKWAGKYYRLGGKVYKNAITLSAPATVTYKNQKEYGRFVALAGLSDRVDPNARVSFEVWADRRKLYESEPLTRLTPAVEINVRIPSTSEELKLVTKGSDLKNRRRAIWINAGFLLKGKHPDVSHVQVFAPGHDPRDFEAVVFASTGQRVDSELLWTQLGGPIEILFDSSDGRLLYFVYLVPKAQTKDQPSSWQPRAGLILETRRTDKMYPECQKLPGLLRVWQEVAQPAGRSLVDSIHHGFPIHPLLGVGSDNAAGKSRLALYHYQGFFRAEKAGQYTFASASNWGSHLLIDGKSVVSWPGQHDYRAGIRGEKRGRVTLKPGIHKLEYLNCSPWGKMFTLAAWQRPRDKLSLMSRSDFLPVRQYVATAIAHKEQTKDQVSFAWQVTDDWRLDQREPALVKMRFSVIKPEHPTTCSYRWKFDDGKIEPGESIEHVFLRPGSRQVTLEVLQGQKVLTELTQKVNAHLLCDKIHFEPGDIEGFERAVSESDFDNLPVGDLVNLYVFADVGKKPQWKRQALAALMKRMDELVAESQHWNFCLDLGEVLCSAPVQQYDQALALLTNLQKKATERSVVRQRAMLCRAELLTRCFGKANEALQILKQIEKKNPDKEIARRLGMAHADTLVALGEAERARDVLHSLPASSGQSNRTKDQVKHTGMLRHARLLSENRDDPEQLDYAMEKIETILAQDPAKMLMPSLNLVRLDIHLARKEYAIAFHLAERLKKLDLTDYYRLETLGRQVRALCGIKAIDRAKAIHEALARDYPYSPVVDETKKAIVEAVVAGRKQ